MSEKKSLVLIENYDLVLQEGTASEVIEFHFEDVNLDWEYQPDSRLNYLTEYFREQKNTNGYLKYFALAAHYDDKSRMAFFNVQLSKKLLERIYSALPHPIIVLYVPLESQPEAGNPHLIKGLLYGGLNLREMVTAEGWRDNCDFHNATYSAPLTPVAVNVDVSLPLAPRPIVPPNFSGLALANQGLFGANRPDQHGFVFASRPVAPPIVIPNPTTPTKYSGCRARFNLAVQWKEPLPLKNIQINSQSFMEKLFWDEETKDLTIISGNGAEIKCHTIIFSAQCPAFSRMLSSQNPMKEAISRRIEMSENSAEGVQTLIKYLYGMQMIIQDLSVDVAVELFQTAHKYDLSHLEGSLHRLFMKMGVGWFTPDTILELYLFVKKLDTFSDLQEHCFLLMTRMDTYDFRACEEFKKLDSLESTDILLKMVEFFKKPVPTSKV